MCLNCHPSHPGIYLSHPRRQAHQLLLSAVYDHTALAVNIKSEHVGEQEVGELGRKNKHS
jgi:hypothetical protein